MARWAQQACSVSSWAVLALFSLDLIQHWVHAPTNLECNARTHWEGWAGDQESPQNRYLPLFVPHSVSNSSCKRLKESTVETPSGRGDFPPQNPTLLCKICGFNFQYLSTERISGHFNIHPWLTSSFSQFLNFISGHFNIHLWHTSGENAGLFPIFLTVSPDKPLLHNLAQSLILWETRSTEFPFYSEPPPFRAITCYFLDALAPPSTYPCQWVRQWVSESFIVSDWRFLSHLFQLNWLF